MPRNEGHSTLFFGPWYRKSPFFEATQRAGAKAYDIYNHMYLPGSTRIRSRSIGISSIM